MDYVGVLIAAALAWVLYFLYGKRKNAQAETSPDIMPTPPRGTFAPVRFRRRRLSGGFYPIGYAGSYLPGEDLVDDLLWMAELAAMTEEELAELGEYGGEDYVQDEEQAVEEPVAEEPVVEEPAPVEEAPEAEEFEELAPEPAPVEEAPEAEEFVELAPEPAPEPAPAPEPEPAPAPEPEVVEEDDVLNDDLNRGGWGGSDDSGDAWGGSDDSGGSWDDD